MVGIFISYKDGLYLWYLCERIEKYLSEKTIGEAIPTFSDNLMINTTIILYFEQNNTLGCPNFPLREIHELMHSFGFEHNVDDSTAKSYIDIEMNEKVLNSIQDILFPYTSCIRQKEINQKYLSCLKYIYSNGEYDGDCSQVNFLEVERGKCPDGTFEVEGTEFCCPKPNMIIKDGYCESV